MKHLLSLALCCVMALSAQAQIPSYVSTNGLVGWWPFNGNANDESGNGNHGTVNGATLAADRFGNTGKAYGFDGVGFISVIDNSTINIQTGGGFSISIWAERTNSNPMGHLIGKRNGCAGNTFQYQIGYNLNGSGIGWGGMNGTSNSYLEYFPVFPINQWNNFVGSFDGNCWKIYQNGIFIDSLVAPKQPAINNNLLIGASGSCQKFVGFLDDIGIWNRALTPQEITNLYQGANVSAQEIQSSSLQVYPNPSKHEVTLQVLPQHIGKTVTVFNSLGQTVLQTKLAAERQTLSVETLPAGIYSMVLNNDRRTTVKLVKE